MSTAKQIACRARWMLAQRRLNDAANKLEKAKIAFRKNLARERGRDPFFLAVNRTRQRLALGIDLDAPVMTVAQRVKAMNAARKTKNTETKL